MNARARPRTGALQVERWFAELTAKQIKRGTHRSTVALEQAIKDYVNTYNENPSLHLDQERRPDSRKRA